MIYDIYEPVRDFLHVKTYYFQIGLWLNKAHAYTCLRQIVRKELRRLGFM